MALLVFTVIEAPGAGWAAARSLAGFAAAAVLLPLFEENGEARVILTKRPETMPSHRGEIAFPGGKFDRELDANLEETALREAREEIGLDTDLVEVVARLEGIATVASAFVITPFVGVLPARPVLAPHPHEVVAVFDVALSDLMADGVYREERWDTWKADLDVHFYELTGETVWGATARILTGFLSHVVTAR
jgi:8-oxo-dGTP pyrophosphatase MutT (NUDIX family)